MRRHWAGIGPLIGAVCLAAVLAGVSYQLEGAPVPKRDSSGGETDHVQSALRAAYQSNIASAISAERPSTPSNAAIWARAGQVPSGGYPIFDPVVVNYKDDEPSRFGLPDFCMAPPTVRRRASWPPADAPTVLSARIRIPARAIYA